MSDLVEMCEFIRKQNSYLEVKMISDIKVPHFIDAVGVLDHIKTMQSRDLPARNLCMIPIHSAIYNRVLVLTDSDDVTCEIAERLPDIFFDHCNPVSLDRLIKENWRPEPERVVYASQEYLDKNKELVGDWGKLTYAVIYQNAEGEWSDLQDHAGYKWGNYKTPSVEVLNGRVGL